MHETLNGHHILHSPGGDPSAVPLLLLHGTGGDESSLMALGRQMSRAATLLGVRGKVLEGSVTRWFSRFGEGLFDLEDVARRADDLANFIEIAAVKLRFPHMPLAVGYSNGANIAGAVLMRQPGVLSGAVLMRGMNSLPPAPNLNLAGKRILYLNGAHDPLAPPESRAVIIANMRTAGADVSEQVTGAGHDIGSLDAEAARAWIEAAPSQAS